MLNSVLGIVRNVFVNFGGLGTKKVCTGFTYEVEMPKVLQEEEK
ncbi:hypothetical protein GCM10007425_24130 [Lysinibacillus alkalisoli]|uniref:Cyclic lactone autoinducer peptide n=1 Tax=Lysinibacillus alkalisoli TaxID=1911548 RepID=A0A917G8P0_9BACI|nr:cyclic lactone autoinducer peptide [Lysinibacillus alkalisoli]GGG28702.1 hypothetical protein GCM10007425_24130 [Lysinibacillus alkalisoli]